MQGDDGASEGDGETKTHKQEDGVAWVSGVIETETTTNMCIQFEMHLYRNSLPPGKCDCHLHARN